MYIGVLALGIVLVFGGVAALAFPNWFLGAPRPDIAMFGSIKEIMEDSERIRENFNDEKWKESERIEIRRGAKVTLVTGLVITGASLLWWLSAIRQ